MPEPSRPCLRPIGMVRALMMVLLLVLAGCGSESKGSGDATSKPSHSSSVAVCMVQGGRLLTRADVDGDGTSDEIRLVPRKGQCPAELRAVTRMPTTSPSAPLSSDDPPVTTAFAVAPTWQRNQLVVTRADHPRGGYQLRIYAASTHKLVELLVGGQPLPFVATDVQENPWSIDCSEHGLVFTQAVAHEPVGVVPAWDIKQTTYVVKGTTVTAGPTKKIADNVLHQDLGTKYPELVKHSAFESCRAS